MQPEWTETFFLELVEVLHERGVRCAITGGLACIEYGVVEHTQDCDLLSDPAGSGAMLSTLSTTELLGARCRYRGNMSAPLHADWLGGGWTSHFVWERGADSAYLDVFGAPPRVLARECLPRAPLEDFGYERLVEEATRAASLGLDPALLTFLPTVGLDLDYGDLQ